MFLQVSLSKIGSTITRDREIYMIQIEFKFITMMDIYQQAWKNIVRPIQIPTKKHLLGPQERKINNTTIRRLDLQVMNRNQKKISGYIFHPLDQQAQQTVLYLHGNGGNKMEALPLVQLIPKFKMNVVSFDFLGCGNSDAQTLTYGINEVFDIRDFLQEVRKLIPIGRVTLWGRSMGALCSIMFSQMFAYEVSGLILDSPFHSLSKVVDRIAQQSVPFPEICLKPVLYLIKNKAAKEANYDIFSIDYLNIFKKLNSNMPVLFIFSHFDGIVPAEQVFEFYNAYKGPKDFCQIYQTHDEDRNEDLFNQCMMWLTRTKRKNIEGLVQARQHLYSNKRNAQKCTTLC